MAASKVTQKVEIEMAHTKSTKNFERYDAVSDDAVISNLYIKIGALGDKFPENIVIAVEAKK